MTRPHRAVKVDANQAEIVADLGKLGAYVWRLSDLGGEVLDLLVCWRGKCLPVEVKAIGSDHALTDGEREGIRKLAQVGVEAVVATCTEDVVRAFEARPFANVIGELGSPLVREEKHGNEFAKSPRPDGVV